MPTENKIAAPEGSAGVDFGIDGRSVRVSQEAYSIFLAREAAGREKIAALQKRLTAADERVDVLEVALRKIKARLDAYSEADMRMPESSVEVCQMIADATLKPTAGSTQSTCTWSEGGFSWRTGCGKDWQFTDGGLPSENGMRFCHSCGKTLVVEGEDKHQAPGARM